MTAPVTLYLADDHQIVIDGLKLLISNEASFCIVGYANDGDTAYTEIKTKQPDIALVDVSMPKMTGLELILALRKTAPRTKFIILSMYGKPNDIRNAINNGASGYMLKNAGKAELVKCLSTVLKGELYFPDLRNQKHIDKSLFTPREQEIVKLICEGLLTADIAARLSLSQHTINTHRKHIGQKTNSNNAFGLSKFLRENQIEL